MRKPQRCLIKPTWPDKTSCFSFNAFGAVFAPMTYAGEHKNKSQSDNNDTSVNGIIKFLYAVRHWDLKLDCCLISFSVSNHCPCSSVVKDITTHITINKFNAAFMTKWSHCGASRALSSSSRCWSHRLRHRMQWRSRSSDDSQLCSAPLCCRRVLFEVEAHRGLSVILWAYVTVTSFNLSNGEGCYYYCVVMCGLITCSTLKLIEFFLIIIRCRHLEAVLYCLFGLTLKLLKMTCKYNFTTYLSYIKMHV